MLSTRLWMGAVLVAALALGLGIDHRLGPPFPSRIPPYPFLLFIAVLVLAAACRELLALLRRQGIELNGPLSYGGVMAVALAGWLAWVVEAAPTESDRLACSLIALGLANMGVLIREGVVYREPGRSMIRAGAGMLVNFYLGVLGAFLIQTRWLAGGLLALACLLAAAKCGDIGAYFGGRALGRHKLYPRLSPQKTIEGSICGLVASVLGVMVAVWAGSYLSGAAPALTWWGATVFGLSVGALAQVGDLVESLLKRDSQQKDASELVPGFGGVLDVLDSPLFCAPLAYGLWVGMGPG